MSPLPPCNPVSQPSFTGASTLTQPLAINTLKFSHHPLHSLVGACLRVLETKSRDAGPFQATFETQEERSIREKDRKHAYF